MKPQDIIFVIVFLLLLAIRKPRFLVAVGLLCLIFAIPLFAFWIFFTAQRLTYYAAVFFLAAVILHLVQNRKR